MPTNAARGWNRLKYVSVERLFGKYDFPMISIAPEDASLPDFGLIYGLNGSGKTTILNTIFHLLNPERNRGHRRRIAMVPFKKFEIGFDNGMVVSATRRGEQLVGGFTYTIRQSSKEPAVSANIVLSSDGKVTEVDNPKLVPLLGIIGSLDLSIIYLTADRIMRASRPELVLSPHRRMYRHETEAQRRRAAEDPEESLLLLHRENLQNLLGRAEDILRSMMIMATSHGEERSTDIYLRIARTLSETGTVEQASSLDVAAQAKALFERSIPFQELGLASSQRLRELSAALESTNPGDRYLISRVVGPYFEALSQRFDALEETRAQIEALRSAFARFLVRKAVDVTMPQGIVIRDTDTDEVLDVSNLSSGEKQLLFLFSTALLARGVPSLIIIDEPELSLNASWQVLLMDSLLQIARGAPVQFLAATHSIEIISQHRELVTELVI